MPWPTGAQPIVQTPAQTVFGEDDPNRPAESINPFQAAGNLALGAGRGLLKTATAVPSFLSQHIPGVNANPAKLAERQKLITPQGTAQSLGMGAEQAGEFLIPGLGEERATAMLPEAARPAGRIAYNALTSGGVNKLQGGSFSTGAVAGGVGGGLSEGMKAAAPKIAEKALALRGTDRAFGKTPGRAILDETKGVRPETVAASAKQRIEQLTPQLEQAADAVSSRPTPKLLPPPPTEIPTGPIVPRDTPGELIPAARAPGTTVISARSPGIRSAYTTSGTRAPHNLPTSGPGILLQHPDIPPAPATVPNATASLAPARQVLSSAAGRATAENAEGLHGQIGNMQDFLSRRFQSGEPIPESVTPRDLLNLKRGFSEEHLGWNPEIRDRALSAGREAYGALDAELDRTVPGAAGLNQRISSLIPTVRRGEAMARSEGATPRILERIARPTGALTGAAGGGIYGYQHGGAPGAIAGAGLGLVLPELVSSPTGRMIAARALNSAAPKYLVPALRGSGLQFFRPSEDEQQ